MGKDILIIEEDAGLGRSLAELLRDRGYGTVLVRDEDDARRFLSTETPCLILVGLLPATRVRALVKFLREHDRTIPAVILSTGQVSRGNGRTERRAPVVAPAGHAPRVGLHATDAASLLRLVDRFCAPKRQRAAVVN
jgi:CheY-like chemotaxis protein